MKKFGYILCLITIFFYLATTNIYGKTLEHIDHNRKENDIAVTFLTSHNTKLLYIESDDQNIGIILEAVSQVHIKKEFPVLKSEKIEGYIVLNEEMIHKLSYKNITFLKDKLYIPGGELQRLDENIILIHDDKKLCVIQAEMSYLDGCDYVYYFGLEKVIEIPDTVKLVIYDAETKDDMRLANYDNFIDTLKLSYHNTSTLIWNKDTYQTVTIP